MRIIEYIPDPFIHALSWSLLHSLWQILIVTIIWFLIIKAVHKAPAMIRQNFSILALLSIPVVFAITFMKQYEIFSDVQKVAFVEYSSAVTESSPAGSLYLLQKNNSALTQFLDHYSLQIFWIYWLGIAIFSIGFILSYSRLRFIRSRQLSSTPSSWSQALLFARTRTQTSSSVEVWLSPHVTVPVVIGFFKPLVLIPLGISSSLTLREVEDILLHEFYHIRCGDQYINTLQYLLEIIFFFHPGTWIISQALRRQREARVDEWVVKQTGQPLAYAHTLLALEEKRTTLLKPALAATSSKNTLLLRIKNIMHMKTRNFKPGQKIAAVAVILLATLSIAWINPSRLMIGHQDFEATYASPLAYNETAAVSTLSPAPAQESTPSSGQTYSPPRQPSGIVLENGNYLEWKDLPDDVKQEISKAMAEAQVAIREAMKEIQTLQSEEFRQEMQQAQQEFKQAMEEVNREMANSNFREEMRKANEELKRAMQEMNREIHSEEFREQMQRMAEETKKALNKIEVKFNDEAFRAEMEETMRNVKNSMDSIDWKKIGQDINIAIENAGKELENLGPRLNEIFRDKKQSGQDSIREEN
jgi:bla regulator protein blaR1